MKIRVLIKEAKKPKPKKFPYTLVMLTMPGCSNCANLESRLKYAAKKYGIKYKKILAC